MEHQATKSEPWSGTKVIYDFGSNNGDDLPYYLKRSDLVIAVEANPTLCDQIRTRFAEEIGKGRLIVENCVLTVDQDGTNVPFYVHRTDHVLSQFPEPAPKALADFERMWLPSKNVVGLIRKHGEPYYIKIDIEHYDQVILRALFENGIRPPFISSESHSIEIFALLLTLGGYGSFNLVDGRSIPLRYSDHTIRTTQGPEQYTFPRHSAGPFGDDIKGPWLPAESFFTLLALEGLGWKDIHASTLIAPDPAFKPQLRTYMEREKKARRIAWLYKHAPAILHPRIHRLEKAIAKRAAR
jgi:FkbM family methyltransferase